MSIVFQASQLHAHSRYIFGAVLALFYFHEISAARILPSALVSRPGGGRDAEGSSQAPLKASSLVARAVHTSDSGSAASMDHGVASPQSSGGESQATSRLVAGRAVRTDEDGDAAKDSRTQTLSSSPGVFNSISNKIGAFSSQKMFNEFMDDVHSLKKSSLIALTRRTELNENSIVMILCSGTLLLLFLLFLVFFFAHTRKPRERYQHMHNGRVIYEWDQTSKELNLYLRPPEGLKKSDFEIGIQSNTIKVGRRGKAPFLRDQLYDTVDKKHSSWALRSSGELQIRLSKVRKAEWPFPCLQQTPQSTSTSSEKTQIPSSAPCSFSSTTCLL